MSFEVVGIRLNADGSGEFITDMNNAGRAVDHFSDSTKVAAEKANTFGGVLDKSGQAVGTYIDANGRMRDANGKFVKSSDDAGAAVTGFGTKAKDTFSQMPGLADIAVGALHRIGEVAVNALGQAAGAAVGFIKDSVTAAGDFQDGMLEFQAVAGKDVDATGLKDFHDLFLTLGKDLPVSTKEVQDAAIEMVKGGIDPATVAAGGLEQALQFATATGIGLSEAAETSAKIVGGWADVTATAADKANLLTHSTDLLTKAANASVVDVSDLSLGLYNVQGTAKTAGLSLDETVTALAEIAPRFSDANTAGTSFRNFLVRLQPSTDPAQQAMKELGLWTEKSGSAFFDAQGKYVGTAKASQILQDATKDLTDADKTKTLQLIFGNDAMNAAAAFSDLGAAGYDNMTASLEKANGVQENAALRQQSLTTAFKNFQGTVEVIQIKLGEVLIPILTDLFVNVLQPGIDTLADIAGALSGDQDAFGRLSPVIQDVVKWIGDLFSGTGGLSDIWTNTLYPAIQTAGMYFQENIVPILENLAKTVLPILKTAVGLIASAWTNIWDIISTDVIPILKDVTAWLAENLPPAVQKVSDFLTNTLFPAIHKAWDFINANLIPILRDVVKWLVENVPPAIQTAANFWNNVLWPALQKVWAFINEKVIPIFTTIVQWLRDNIPPALQKLADFWNNTLLPAITTVWTFINDKLIPLFQSIAHVAEAVLGLAIRTLTKIWNEELYPAITTIYNWLSDHLGPIFGTVGDKASGLADTLKTVLTPAFEWLNDHVFKPVSDWLGTIGDKISDLIGWLDDLADTINGLPGLPDEYEGQSPPPMAKWMTAIGDGSAYAASALHTVGRSMPNVDVSGVADAAYSMKGLFAGDILAPMDDNATTASNALTKTLQPAISITADYINKRVVPAIQSLASTQFPALDTSVTATATIWTDTLQPTLEKVQDFISTKFIPLLKDLEDMFRDKIGKATSDYTTQLNNGLLPGLQAVGGFLSDTFGPVLDQTGQHLETVTGIISNRVVPVFTEFGTVLKDIVNWFDRIGQGIEYVIHALNALADTIRNMPSLPDAYTGKSPPPMAKWMTTIGNTSAYAANAMTAVGRSVRGLPASPMAIMAAGATSNTYNQQRSVALNYHTTYAPPASQSLALASALAG